MLSYLTRYLVFPTCVGMNRRPDNIHSSVTRVPHMRGDELRVNSKKYRLSGVFPTCVGMNRNKRPATTFTGSVPHMRGDEPRKPIPARRFYACSPHAWG